MILPYSIKEDSVSKVTLIYASWCPSCPAAKSFWSRLRQEVSFSYEEIDIESEKGKELAERYNIRSVPASLVNGRPYFVGIPEKQRALALLRNTGAPT